MERKRKRKNTKLKTVWVCGCHSSSPFFSILIVSRAKQKIPSLFRVNPPRIPLPKCDVCLTRDGSPFHLPPPPPDTPPDTFLSG